MILPFVLSRFGACARAAVPLRKATIISVTVPKLSPQNATFTFMLIQCVFLNTRAVTLVGFVALYSPLDDSVATQIPCICCLSHGVLSHSSSIFGTTLPRS